MSTTEFVDGSTPEQLVSSVVRRAARSMEREGERITVEKLVGRAIAGGDAPSCSAYLFHAVAEEYVDEHADRDRIGLDVDHRAGEGRSVCRPPQLRQHEDYEQPHWATAHLEDVDNVFATGDREEVRIDLDGVGSGGASLHDIDDNVNLSVWFDHDRARELIDALQAAVQDTDEENGGFEE